MAAAMRVRAKARRSCVEDGETRHLTPALSPFCSADFAKRGEGKTLAAFWRNRTFGRFKGSRRELFGDTSPRCSAAAMRFDRRNCVGDGEFGICVEDGETRHLTPALSPFCSADFAKRGEGETLAAFWRNRTFGWFKGSRCELFGDTSPRCSAAAMRFDRRSCVGDGAGKNILV